MTRELSQSAGRRLAARGALGPLSFLERADVLREEAFLLGRLGGAFAALASPLLGCPGACPPDGAGSTSAIDNRL